LRKRTLPYRGETNQFVQGYCVRDRSVSHVAPELSGLALVQIGVRPRQCPLWVKSRHQIAWARTSALPRKADINSAVQNVCYVPKADITTRVTGRNPSKIGGAVPRLHYSGRPALRRPSSMPSKLRYLDRQKISRSRSIVRPGSSSSSRLSAALASSM